MRSFICALVITAVIISSCLLYVNKMDEISLEMITINERTYDFIAGENYTEAEKSTEELKQYLEDNRVLLAATGDHEEIKELEIRCCELTEIIRCGIYCDAMAKCASIEMLLRHLPSNYKMRAENIL